MMRYLQFDKLKEMGLEFFDQWASIFTEPTSEMELAPEGVNYQGGYNLTLQKNIGSQPKTACLAAYGRTPAGANTVVGRKPQHM